MGITSSEAMYSYSQMNDITFVRPNASVLDTIAAEVCIEELRSEEMQTFLKKLKAFASGKVPGHGKILVGLAAPQIGLSKRVILVDQKADGKGKTSELRVFINPTLSSKSAETAEWYEACASTGNIAGIVSRAASIELTAWDLDGKKIVERFEGYTARIIQHEIDHLDGIRFPSRIDEEGRLHWVEPDEFPKYRNYGAWRFWPTKATKDQWLQIRYSVPENPY